MRYLVMWVALGTIGLVPYNLSPSGLIDALQCLGTKGNEQVYRCDRYVRKTEQLFKGASDYGTR